MEENNLIEVKEEQIEEVSKPQKQKKNYLKNKLNF
jgi:hypothetical protein